MEIYVSSRAHQRLWYYILSVTTEIGGMGYARMLPDSGGDVLWEDAFLCPQYATQGGVDFDDLGGDEFAVEKAINDGVLSDPQFVWISWHSHGNMQTFWSNTDDDRIEALRASGIKHLISFVGNRKREYRVRYDAFDVDHYGCRIPQLTIDNLSLYLDAADPVFEELQREVDENLKERPKVAPPRSLPAVWRGGKWHIGGQTVPGTLDSGPLVETHSTSVRQAQLTESAQADSAFSIEPQEGSDVPVVVANSGYVDDDDLYAGWGGVD